MPRHAESSRRYLALARAVLRARRRPFDPFKLTWIVTERCSLHCGPCQLWVGTPHDGPDLATCRRVLDANPQLTWLNLSGGDLVERPDAPALLSAVAESLPDLALLDFPTAGQDTAAVLAAIEPLLDSAIPRLFVSVSLDGPDAVHDRVRRKRGAAAAARATWRRLRQIRRPGFTVVAGMTLSSQNVPDGYHGPVRDLLPPDVPPSELHLNLAHHSTHYYRNAPAVRPPAGTSLRLIGALMQRRGWPVSPLDWMERRYWNLARRHLLEGDTGVRCGALAGSVFLGSDLSVHPCTIYDRRLGNLADVGYSLRRIAELPGARAARDAVEAGACPRCWSPCEAFPTLLLNLGRSR